MAATYMLRKHLAAREAMKRPEAVREREIDCTAAERAAGDLRQEYPIVTPDNIEAADAYHKQRLAHWRRELRTPTPR